MTAGRDAVNTSALTGGCYCGDVRYRIEGPVLRSTTCRCDSCARSIDAHVAWLTVPSDGVVLVAGEPERRTDGPVTRTFCGRCGTKLTYRDDGRGETDVTVSSLDGVCLMPMSCKEHVSQFNHADLTTASGPS